MTDHPADETLAEFIDGRLSPEERQSVMTHIAECAECRDVFLTAGDMAQEETGETMAPVVPMRRSRWWMPAAGVAAAAALVFGFFQTEQGDRVLAPRRIDALRNATTELKERPIAARPSIDMPWKYKSTSRGVEDDETTDITEYYPIHRAGEPIGKAAGRHRTPANLHHYGLVLLLANEPNDAILLFEEALTAETGKTDITQAIAASTNADLLNDLAAAYYERHDQKRLPAITRAWQLKKSRPIAWTRATILFTKEAWNDYLALDSTSEWAKEARDKLDLLDYAGN